MAQPARGGKQEGRGRLAFFARRVLGRVALREPFGQRDARGRGEVVHEAADVLYYVAAALAREGVAFADVERELDLRARRVTRRGGDAKPAATEVTP